MFIVDAHLDLAYNALRGRDVLRPAAEQTADEEGIPTVGIPDLYRGGVGLICATIFCMPSINGGHGYASPEQANEAGIEQLRWYQRQDVAGQIRIIKSPREIPDGSDPSGPIPAVILLEGADPLRSPDDVRSFFDSGVRIVGLAWKQTRYAGGTGAPGPLTAAGIALVRELDQFGIIHDASHLAEESFWELLDLSGGGIIASHSNCRAIVPTDRQLSDDMARAIFARGGVVGINFFDKFLMPPAEYKTRRATIADVVRHVRHLCNLAGNAEQVGLGTDMDGGLGREEIPAEIKSSADLSAVANCLSAAGFSDPEVRGIIGQNWLTYFRHRLAGI